MPAKGNAENQAKGLVEEETTSLDIGPLRDAAQGNKELERELVSVFLSETDVLLGDICRAIEARDMERLRRTAHTLKGVGASMGAPGLKEHAGRLEEIASGMCHGDVAETLGRLKAECGKVGGLLRRHVEP